MNATVGRRAALGLLGTSAVTSVAVGPVHAGTGAVEPAESLVRAVLADDLAAVTAALANGASPASRDQTGRTVLHLAAGPGNARMVRLLLDAGADPLTLERRLGASPLHIAAQGGSIRAAAELLRAGALINLRAHSHGNTPLYDAVWHDQLPMVRYLLANGADPTVPNWKGRTVRQQAEAQFPAALPVLDQYLAVRDRAAKAELRTGALTGDLAAVRRALDAGAEINTRAPDGHTALLDAAREGHTEVVRLLLSRGADPAIVDTLMEATPAHKAGYMGHSEVARLLVRHRRLALNAQGPYNGYTALHDAAWHGHTATVEVFLAAGADTRLRGLDGDTAREVAAKRGHQVVVALIDRYQRGRH